MWRFRGFRFGVLGLGCRDVGFWAFRFDGFLNLGWHAADGRDPASPQLLESWEVEESPKPLILIKP